MKKIFIPIKEHSERVPRKNFRDFGGKPLYQYVISKYIDYDSKGHKIEWDKFYNDMELWVDTDSDEIKNWVNAECPDNFHAYSRPKQLVGDDVSVNLLIGNFVYHHCNNDDVIVQTHVTSPFLNPLTICRVSRLRDLSIDSTASANVINSRLWRRENYGWCPINHNPMKMEKTQDLPAVYEENSAFYAFTVDSFKKNGKRIGESHRFVEVSFPHNLDIDTEKDFEMALALRECYEK